MFNPVFYHLLRLDYVFYGIRVWFFKQFLHCVYFPKIICECMNINYPFVVLKKNTLICAVNEDQSFVELKLFFYSKKLSSSGII